MVTSTSRIIVALDLPTAEAAVELAAAVAEHVAGFKVGLGLLHGPGPGVVSALVGLGRPVFADAKLHDIPSQVEAAAEQLGRRGARWVTVHLSGGRAMVRAAVEGLARGAGDAPSGILGVTVLTSLDGNRLGEVGIQQSPGRLVSKMSRLALDVGCEGVITSSRELKVVADVAPDLLRVTPGIRQHPGGDDQTRSATPAEALARGADLLVVGRPITRAADPVGAAATLAAEAAEVGVRRPIAGLEPTA